MPARAFFDSADRTWLSFWPAGSRVKRRCSESRFEFS